MTRTRTHSKDRVDRARIVAETMDIITNREGYQPPGGRAWIDLEVPIRRCVLDRHCFYADEWGSVQDEANAKTRGADPVHVPVVEVTSETTLEACRRLAREPGVADRQVLALNFASATEPGGGFLRGSQAQEESLCRSS